MSEYKSIKGKTVQFLGSDPSETSTEGQVWYNSTAGAFKSLLALEAWSSGGNLVTGRADLGGTGIQTAALGFGGYVGPGTPNISSVTEEYNGSGWSSGGTMGTGRRSVGGAGTQTAGLAVGGTTTIPGAPGITNATEEYDGSAWTSGGNLNTGRIGVGGLGLQTAAVAFGGASSPFTDRDITEEYNGSVWTAVPGTITSARRYIKGCGTQTAGLGTSPTGVDEYDGTSWTAGGTFNTGRPNAGSFAGIQTSAIMGGGGNGGTPNSGATESYDGSTWTTSPATMATGRYSIGGAGSSNTSSLGFGGTGYTTSTEEYNKSVNVITAAAFSSGGNANTARRQLGYTGAGTQNSFMVYGGFAPGSFQNVSEEYNGSSWTATPNLNSTRGQLAGFGTSTAAVACGGNPTADTTTEEYNGSTWTSVTGMSTGRYEFGGSGIETAGLALQGDQGPGTPFGTTCEEYNGTSWTSGGTANTARRTNSGVGTQTATITAGGQTSPGDTANVESYDGTTWSEVNNLNTSRGGNAIMGGPAGATSSVITGGQVPQTTITEQWNGTNMVTGVNMANDRSVHGAGGTSALGVVGLGQNGPSPPYGFTSTEEFTGESSALNLKTLTTS
jgi:hypothetical protein